MSFNKAIEDFNGLDRDIVNMMSRDTIGYKHKPTGVIISVSEFYLRFARDTKSTKLYDNGELKIDYERILK